MGDAPPEEPGKENFYYGVHVAASSSWGDQACARLCQLVIGSNNGLAQQIAENKTDLLDVLPPERLAEPVDDLGLTLPFLAVYHDRPDMLEYLWRRGVDLTTWCDPMEYGNVLFYAIHLRRIQLILKLDLLSVSVRDPCDCLKNKPIVHAKRLNDPNVTQMLEYCFGKEQRAATLVVKHFLRIKYRKIYLKKLALIPLLLRVMRGMIHRARVRRVKKKKNDLIRRTERRVRRQQKIDLFQDLNSDDESTIEDPNAYGF
jgi:hypothetical protein